MRYPIRHLLLSIALLCVVGARGDAQAPAQDAPPPQKTVPNFVPVTDAMLRSPKPEDWLLYRGNYQGWGYSPLEQINKGNVKNLQLVWSRMMAPGLNEITPIVHDGVMYLGNPGDVIQAIDAGTGDLFWEYRHPLPAREEFPAIHGQRKRSISLYGDKVIFATWNNFIVGLDARTGRRVWQSNRGGNLFVQNSSGPIVMNGVVVAGSTCQVAGFGCYVTGHNVTDGEEVWRNEMIPRAGQPGYDTWGGAPFDKRWMTGVWGLLTYDPDLDLVYYGSSGAGPASEAQRGTIGGTMAGTNTRFAVKPKTGEVVWKHQTLPRDNWDQECTFEMMIIKDRNRLELRCGDRRILMGKTDSGAEPYLEDRWKRIGQRERGVGDFRCQQDLPDLPNLYGWQGLADGRLQSQDQHHVRAAFQCLHRRDGAHRSRSQARVCLQHDQCRSFSARQRQGWSHRRDLSRDR